MTDIDLAQIVTLISRVGEIESLSPSEDFYEAGLSSINALTLLMELEDTFGVSIPDEQFVHARTADALQHLLMSLQA
ncbi:MAG TPA: acyl carrier protein [Candidatus Baltobacteraceae bacterium]